MSAPSAASRPGSSGSRPPGGSSTGSPAVRAACLTGRRLRGAAAAVAGPVGPGDDGHDLVGGGDQRLQRRGTAAAGVPR
jgi:hypothetical protein